MIKNINKGDKIFVESYRKGAELEVRTVLGSRIIYEVIKGNEYYGTRSDQGYLYESEIEESSRIHVH